ncbi:tetratricopeptide repeat protein [Aestuariirhabdus sp. LZHN29]|uniref:tetratricopeptide repeat protein n=1 Tax=Aestuariirhabdus sp. LZHN29 TaxID=3417462 RepID=UPI003CECBF1F
MSNTPAWHNSQKVWSFLLVVASGVAYYTALTSGFVLDDWPVIVENPAIRSLVNSSDFFTQSVWSNTEEKSNNFIYRPLFLLTVAFNYQLWGLEPFGYHLTNLLLHCANALLLLQVLRLLLPSAALPCLGFGTLLFALHPSHVESVNWISGVTDPQLSFAILLCFYGYLRSDNRGWLLLSWTAFACALLAKEVAVTFPLVLLVIPLLRRQPINWLRWLPYAGLVGIYFVLRSQALGDSGTFARFSIEQLPTLLGFAGHYLQLLVIPWPSGYYYSPPSTPLSITTGWVIIAILCLLCWRAWRQANWQFLLGGIWFAATLAPALALSLLDTPTFALRFLYLPSIGATIALVAWLQSFEPKRFAYPVMGVVSIVFGALCIQDGKNWANDKAFYSYALENSGDHPGPFIGLARTVARDPEAIDLDQLLLLIEQQLLTAQQQRNLLEMIATDYGKRGQLELSRSVFGQLTGRFPDYAMGWLGLGNLAWLQGDLPGAMKHYLAAAQLQPNDPQICQNLRSAMQVARNQSHRTAYLTLCRP